MRCAKSGADDSFIGINTGHEGFLLNLDTAIRDNPSWFLQQCFTSVLMPMLHVEVTKPDGSRQSEIAFNDAWLQVERGKMGWFELEINGNLIQSGITGDGILVATPAGSTAYAYNAGTDPVPLEANTFVIAGLNIARKHNWRGEPVPDDSVITIRSADATRWRKIYGMADNTDFGEVTEMTIRKSRTSSAEVLFAPGFRERRRHLLQGTSEKHVVADRRHAGHMM